MAVPTSGAISMLGLAQESLYGTYGSGSITSPIHLYDLVNGGEDEGSGNDYPTVNTSCAPNPVDRTYTSFVASNSLTVFITTSKSLLAVNDIIYSNSSGTIYTGSTIFLGTNVYQNLPSLFSASNSCGCETIGVNSSTGQITGTNCGCP